MIGIKRRSLRAVLAIGFVFFTGWATDASAQIVRKNQRELSKEEREAFAAALHKMKALGTYDKYVELHSLAFGQTPNPAHGAPNQPGKGGTSFLPWHRKMIFDFEKDLLAAHQANIAALPNNDPRKKVQLTGLPYWEWSVDGDAAKAGTPFSDDFVGKDGTVKFFDGAAQKDFKRADGNALVRALGKAKIPLGGGMVEEVKAPSGRDRVTKALEVNVYDADPWNARVDGTKSFRNHLEGWNPALHLHNRVHIYVGGPMGGSKSPDDPIFFLNHSEVDRIWAIWEDREGKNRYDVTGANPKREEVYPSTGPAPNQSLKDKLLIKVDKTGPTPKLVEENITPEELLDITGAKLGYQYEMTTNWTAKANGNWNDLKAWDIQSAFLLDRFPMNNTRLLWSVTLPDDGKEIKQNVAGLTINRLNNVGYTLTVDNATTVKGKAFNGPKGTIKVQAGKSLVIDDVLTSDGTLVNKELIKAKAIVNSKAAKVDPAVFEITGLDPEDMFDNLPTGTVAGAGEIIGRVRNAGLFDPGALDVALAQTGPGVLGVTGPYEQTPLGGVVLDIYGVGAQDKLAVSGDGNFAGDVFINFAPGFAPQNGQSFNQLITVAGLRSGDFPPPNVHVFGVQPGFTYTSGFDGAGNFNLQSTASASSAVPVLATTLTGDGPNFGVVRIGDSRTANLSVANSGNLGSLLRTTFTPGPDDFRSALDQDAYLEANQSVMGPITYRPSDHGPDSWNAQVIAPGDVDSYPLSGVGMGPDVQTNLGGDNDVDFGNLPLNGQSNFQLRLSNLTSDASMDDALTGVTILDAFITENELGHFVLDGFTPGTLLSKEELLDLNLAFTAHDDVLNSMLVHNHGSMSDPVHFYHATTFDSRAATLHIVTDQEAPFGQAGRVFSFNLIGTIVPEPASWLLGLLGALVVMRNRREGAGG